MNNTNQQVTQNQLWGLILLAYIFSFAMRMIWVWQFQDSPNFFWNNEMMINTNDGYTWAAGAQNILYGLHEHNAGIRDIWSNGIIFFTVLLVKITPFNLNTVILYMPTIISSFVVVPIILIARLYKQTIWGFLAALLGSIAWSYYNRTMMGYYDTDMFAAMAPMFILYFLMKSTIDFNLKSALYAAIAITFYPFLYDQGQAVIYAMGIIYTIYMIFYHRKENTTYLSLILVFVALTPLPLLSPDVYLIKIALLLSLYFILKGDKLDQKLLIILSSSLFILFLFYGNVFSLILGKVMGYLITGTKSEGLHFYSVIQTVREAGQIPFSTFANRISGSQIGVVIAFIGYIVLVIKNRAFILALPLIGIGFFALWGGLRFTVYAVPIAAMSAIYLFFVIADTFIKSKFLKYSLITIATAGMIYPNIVHIIGYKVPTVLNKAEVEDLDKLKSISTSKDYTLAWWDYGYPIWYYSNTNTLIDGGKHNNDNFIISKILQTSSADFAVNLSRLAVETYVSSNYKTVADTLFKNKMKDQIDPNIFLSKLDDKKYILPKKTRDIYLYLPYRMMKIFPTVSLFGNLDLTTGKVERKINFYPSNAIGNKAGVITFANGIKFDSKKGELILGKQKEDVKAFIITQNTKFNKIKVRPIRYHFNGKYVVLYLKSYKQFIVLDNETFNSTFVQMFMLGKYDKELFELVVASPYSRIYKLKK